MRYLALAADYDGTLAHHGTVAPEVIAALTRLAASGRKLILVTGRELDELLGVFPDIAVFDRVVAENGALLYYPKTRERKPIAEPPPPSFAEELVRRGVAPLSCGNCIVATVQPHETVVLAAIRDLGLELQVIFNKGAVMVLPPGINKASGLVVAAAELGLSTHNVVAVGDGENDHALLETAEYSVAVANAVPMLQEKADRVTAGRHGDGVMELIADLLESDLASRPPRAPRRTILLGTDGAGAEITMPPAGMSVLVAGSSGAGKSTLASGILERLQEQGYQYCIVDPEGDYAELTDAVVLGNAQRAPNAEEIMTALEKPDVNVAINLIGLKLEDRPDFFLSLLPRLQELRVKTGRPHWILADETHHLLPADHHAPPTVLTQDLASMIYVTVHPDWIAPAVLKTVNMIAALGETPAAAIEKFCAAAGLDAPALPERDVGPGQALVWTCGTAAAPFVLDIAPSRTERRRHRRKYAEGELPPERSFFFRGPEGKLNLRAQNLILFNQIADGVDDETWQHHLARGDYSKWMRACIKDDALAEQVATVEHQNGLSAAESRRLVREAVEEHYTLPASAPAPA